jgi:putative ABC transport system permease protein
MKFLNKKLRRDILKNWSQFFSVFLMALLSVLIYVGLEGAYHGMEKSVDDFTKRGDLADSWVMSIDFTTEDVDSFKSIKNVNETATKKRILAEALTKDKNNYLYLDTPIDGEITKPILVAGKQLKQGDSSSILLNEDYAKANQIHLGDKISLHYQNQIANPTVVGLILSPDRLYYTGTPEFVAPVPHLYGYGIMNQETLATLDKNNTPNILEVKGGQTNVRKEAPDILGDRYVAYYNQHTLPDVSAALDRVGQIQNLSLLFSFIFILLAILAMYTTIKRLIETQTKDIATLKALGYSNAKLGWHYTSFGLAVGGIGALVGWGIAPIMSNFVLGTQKQMFALDNWHIAYTASSVGVTLLVLAICMLAAFFASRKAIKGLPVKYFRGNLVKNSKHIFLEKNTRFWNALRYGDRWALRDAMSSPVRILMGIIGVTGCMMLLMAGFGMPDSMNGQVTDSYGEDFTYTYRVETTANDLPTLKKELPDAQSIQSVSTRIYPDDGYDYVLNILGKGNYVNVQTTDGKSILDDGVYVTEGVADAAGLAKGQTIELLVSRSKERYKLKISGIIHSSVPQGAYITEKMWKKMDGNYQPTILMVGDNVTYKQLDQNTKIHQIISMKEQRKVATELVDSLESIFMLIKVFAILLGVVILYNLGALSFTERRREYATLRVLGYQKSQISSLAIKENIFTTVVGWIIGLPLGFLFLDQYVSTFSTYQITYYPKISVVSIIIASIITIVASLTTSFLIGRRIRKLDMIEAIKGVE